MNSKKVKTSRERTLITYVDLWHTADVLQKLGGRNERGSLHQFLASIVFRAFAFEAFLNHVGEELFESWVDLERLRPRGKVNIICEKLDIKPNYGNMPWQIIPKLMVIRTKVAHGKNELLTDERILSADIYDEEMGKILRADWQEYATKDNAKSVRDKLEELMKEIWEKAGLEEHAVFRGGFQTGSAAVVED